MVVKTMNKSVRKQALLLISLLFLLPVSVSAQYVSREVDMYITGIASELDGSQTVRVSGEGRDKADVKEQCLKNAVYAFLFMGVHSGKVNALPLVSKTEHRKHQEYFDAFFEDGGEYKNYASWADKKMYSNKRSKDKIQRRYEMTVRVLVSKLRSRLKADGITVYEL